MQRQYLDLRKARPNFTKSCSVLGEFVRHSPESRQTPMAEPQGEGLVLKLRVFPICITPAILRLPPDPYYQHRFDCWKLQAQEDLSAHFCLERTVTQLRGWACFLSFFTCLSWASRHEESCWRSKTNTLCQLNLSAKCQCHRAFRSSDFRPHPGGGAASTLNIAVTEAPC